MSKRIWPFKKNKSTFFRKRSAWRPNSLWYTVTETLRNMSLWNTETLDCIYQLLNAFILFSMRMEFMLQSTVNTITKTRKQHRVMTVILPAAFLLLFDMFSPASVALSLELSAKLCKKLQGVFSPNSLEGCRRGRTLLRSFWLIEKAFQV